MAAKIGRSTPFSKACRETRDDMQSLLDNARHPLELRCLWRSQAVPEAGWNQGRARALPPSSRPISFIRFWLFFSVICKLERPAANEVLQGIVCKDWACRITRITPPP
jgi:hypothetical protein